MRWRMMISEIVTHIGVTGLPTYIELVLFNPVFDPLESLVHGCVIDDAICGGVSSFQFPVLWNLVCGPFQKGWCV
jgi:hypothetical protein